MFEPCYHLACGMPFILFSHAWYGNVFLCGSLHISKPAVCTWHLPQMMISETKKGAEKNNKQKTWRTLKNPRSNFKSQATYIMFGQVHNMVHFFCDKFAQCITVAKAQRRVSAPALASRRYIANQLVSVAVPDGCRAGVLFRDNYLGIWSQWEHPQFWSILRWFPGQMWILPALGPLAIAIGFAGCSTRLGGSLADVTSIHS